MYSQEQDPPAFKPGIQAAQFLGVGTLIGSQSPLPIFSS
jgi:hypothetical protein